MLLPAPTIPNNPDVEEEEKQLEMKDADKAVVVAVTSAAIFEFGEEEPRDDVYKVGVAFPLLQALQRVNECLLHQNPAESLLFDVILITTNHRQQEQSHRITHSTKHYGLDIGRFVFCGEEDFVEGLLKNKVQLFLSDNTDEASKASHGGLVSALLDAHTASCPSQQLRVLLCADVPGSTASSPLLRYATQDLSAQLGQMQRRFGAGHSPLSIALVTWLSGREICGHALQMMRSWGVSVDEAYCLAGTPRGPILSVLRPHILLRTDLSSLEA